MLIKLLTTLQKALAEQFAYICFAYGHCGYTNAGTEFSVPAGEGPSQCTVWVVS